MRLPRLPSSPLPRGLRSPLPAYSQLLEIRHFAPPAGVAAAAATAPPPAATNDAAATTAAASSTILHWAPPKTPRPPPVRHVTGAGAPPPTLAPCLPGAPPHPLPATGRPCLPPALAWYRLQCSPAACQPPACLLAPGACVPRPRTGPAFLGAAARPALLKRRCECSVTGPRGGLGLGEWQRGREVPRLVTGTFRETSTVPFHTVAVDG